ncbi:hypothetical protein CR513_10615, partial [Mucuna pruriens]
MGSGALVLYYSRPSTLNCGVLMGSGALVLCWYDRTCQVLHDQRLYVCHHVNNAKIGKKYYSRPSTLNCRVLMGTGALVPSLGSKKQRHKKEIRKKMCNTRTSQEVTHASTTLAQARLTAEF